MLDSIVEGLVGIGSLRLDTSWGHAHTRGDRLKVQAEGEGQAVRGPKESDGSQPEAIRRDSEARRRGPETRRRGPEAIRRGSEVIRKILTTTTRRFSTIE